MTQLVYELSALRAVLKESLSPSQLPLSSRVTSYAWNIVQQVFDEYTAVRWNGNVFLLNSRNGDISHDTIISKDDPTLPENGTDCLILPDDSLD